ncbi:hypothetical protein M378DRAFT_19030 [Amanita muscaria Koide BX008]|uniref:C2H2-type domain-containing protein n=1 Tax=Amanita muscaria (strain Koide BX008) TaxID=946122 RepID=A0A0C2WCH4_AMAMK|nr:hypothetical protein M378DRAFT_19045 [Amanita muscaria Koide BX008]KIL54308.1 hypothetical protein M378DRAFT_19030 [Amanita muscaria Koide BX008]
MFSDPPVAPEDPSMKNLYPIATAPSFDSYSYHNLHDSSHLQTESRTQPIAPGAMNMAGLWVRKDRWPRIADTRQPVSATDTYQNSPMATMDSVPTSSTQAVPYFNQSFNPMGVTPANIHSFSNSFPFSNGFCYPYSSYDTQPKPSTLAVASNTPILRINVEYPLNQSTSSGLQVPKPTSYLSNDYVQGIPSMLQSQANYDWKNPVQTANSVLPMGLSVPTIFDSEGYYMKSSNAKELQDVPQHTFYDQHGKINVAVGDTRSISATQSILSSSISRGRDNLRSTRKRRRESPSPHAPTPPLACPSTVSAESGSKQDQGTSYICRWNGCNRQLPRDTTKLTYSHHLDKYHDFRGGTDQTIIECRWMEPGLEPGTVCRCMEKLQKQSVIKHTAGKHLKIMITDCPLCGSSQARSDNMFRHFKSCDEFHALGEEEKKELWEVHTAQPFDEYIKSERTRQNKTTRKKRKVTRNENHIR